MAGGNPIRKMRCGVWGWSLNTHIARQARVWVAVCPDCGKIISASGYIKNTRKGVKDLLHLHSKNKHGGPGGYST